jgi:signal recognition particle subunit SRP72
MAKNQQALEPLFKELDNFIQENEYNKAIKSCEKILGLKPDDIDAFKCKVICLIHLGQYQDALDMLDSNSALSRDLVFERAYCYYRTKKLNEALALIKNIPKPKPIGILELQAQVCYRMEDYEQCIAIYEELINQHKVDSAELKTNMCAAYTEEGKIKECQSLIAKNKALLQQTFEFAFNAACSFIASGDYKAAEMHLNLAQQVCRKTLQEDGASEEEIQDELAIVLVQMGYCLQMMGREAEAMELYNSVLKSKPSDAAALAVASNNFVSIKRNHELFDSLKKLKSATSEAV